MLITLIKKIFQRLKLFQAQCITWKSTCKFIIIIASHPCQGIGHRQTSSTRPCLELSCLEPPTSCQHLSFLFPCMFSMSPVAYPCLSSPADSTKEPVVQYYSCPSSMYVQPTSICVCLFHSPVQFFPTAVHFLFYPSTLVSKFFQNIDWQTPGVCL